MSSCRAFSIPDPTFEFKFHPTRRWAFDYAWLEFQIAIEQEGGLWIMGRHNRGSGFTKDAEKYNAAAILGWIVLRYTPQQINAGLWIADFEMAVAYRRRGSRHVGIHQHGEGQAD